MTYLRRSPVLDPLHLLTEFSLAMHFQIHPEQLITSTGGNSAPTWQYLK